MIESTRDPAPPASLTITYAEELEDAKTLSISPEVEAVLGYTQAEWMADPLIWVRLMHPEDRDRVVLACAESNRLGQPFDATYRMIARDGRVVRIHDHAELVRGSQDQPLVWQGVMVPDEEREEASNDSGE